MADFPNAQNLTSSAGLAHLQAVYYSKKGLDRLMKKFRFRQAATHDMLPKRSGRTVQFFRYTNFAADTTAATEGTTGTSLNLTSRILQATVSQYTAFITVSDLLKDTAIDPIVTSASELLAYRAGLSVDTITRAVIDAESASTNLNPLATNLRVADLRNARHQLQALDVQPFEDNQFLVFAHPFATYDLVNDPDAAGLADIFKYTDPKGSPLVKYADRDVVTSVAGCKVVESTNVYFGGTPTKYRTYVFGYAGIGCVDLEGRGPSDVVDPKRQNFKINVIPGELSVANPEGKIGAVVSYNFVFTTVVLDGPAGIGGTYRYRTIDAESTIG
jgi:N4-gp56 family major capsid protein